MKEFKEPKLLQKYCSELKKQGKTIALVPTMGYFHKGHELLIEEARKLADALVVSIFVNPSQFAPTEDLDSYPKDLKNDLEKAYKLGTDIAFLPEPSSMYSVDYDTWVESPVLSKKLCGASRPIHFRGVCTVVAKLFNLIKPDVAVFGQKDWQQLAIIKKMVKELDFDVNIVGIPIVREKDGLAMSSRNAYLTAEERLYAPSFNKGLEEGKKTILAGNKNPKYVIEIIRKFWKEYLPLGREDYLVCVDPNTLEELAEIKDSALLASAYYLGKARIIDNILIDLTYKELK